MHCIFFLLSNYLHDVAFIHELSKSVHTLACSAVCELQPFIHAVLAISWCTCRAKGFLRLVRQFQWRGQWHQWWCTHLEKKEGTEAGSTPGYSCQGMHDLHLCFLLSNYHEDWAFIFKSLKLDILWPPCHLLTIRPSIMCWWWNCLQQHQPWLANVNQAWFHHPHQVQLRLDQTQCWYLSTTKHNMGVDTVLSVAAPCLLQHAPPVLLRISAPAIFPWIVLAAITPPTIIPFQSQFFEGSSRGHCGGLSSLVLAHIKHHMHPTPWSNIVHSSNPGGGSLCFSCHLQSRFNYGSNYWKQVALQQHSLGFKASSRCFLALDMVG